MGPLSFTTCNAIIKIYSHCPINNDSRSTKHDFRSPNWFDGFRGTQTIILRDSFLQNRRSSVPTTNAADIQTVRYDFVVKSQCPVAHSTD